MIDEQFKTYFKFPLIYKENFLYVLTNDSQMALTWLKDSSEIEDPFEIVNKMNGYSDKQFKEKWSIKDNVFIRIALFCFFKQYMEVLVSS